MCQRPRRTNCQAESASGGTWNVPYLLNPVELVFEARDNLAAQFPLQAQQLVEIPLEPPSPDDAGIGTVCERRVETKPRGIARHCTPSRRSARRAGGRLRPLSARGLGTGSSNPAI